MQMYSTHLCLNNLSISSSIIISKLIMVEAVGIAPTSCLAFGLYQQTVILFILYSMLLCQAYMGLYLHICPIHYNNVSYHFIMYSAILMSACRTYLSSVPSRIVTLDATPIKSSCKLRPKGLHIEL